MADDTPLTSEEPGAYQSLELPAWQEVAPHFQEQFPGHDQQAIRRRWEQHRTLSQERERYRYAEETPEGYLGRRAVPFGSAATQAARTVAYGNARQRFEQGKPEDEDYGLMAAYERQQYLDANQSLVGHLLHIPAIVGEGMGAGRLLGRAGVMGGEAVAGQAARSGLRQAAEYTGRAALTTAHMPSMWLPEWTEENVAHGRNPLDLRGLPRAAGLGTMQTMVFGSLSRIANDIPGSELGAYLRRGAVRTGYGLAEQQGIDLISGVLTQASDRPTGYGILGDLIQGRGGDALQHVARQAVTFAAFSALHEAQHRPITQAHADALRELARGGMNRDLAAAEVARVQDAVKKAYADNPDLTRDQAREVIESLGLPEGRLRDLGMALAEHLPFGQEVMDTQQWQQTHQMLEDMNVPAEVRQEFRDRELHVGREAALRYLEGELAEPSRPAEPETPEGGEMPRPGQFRQPEGPQPSLPRPEPPPPEHPVQTAARRLQEAEATHREAAGRHFEADDRAAGAIKALTRKGVSEARAREKVEAEVKAAAERSQQTHAELLRARQELGDLMAAGRPPQQTVPEGGEMPPPGQFRQPEGPGGREQRPGIGGPPEPPPSPVHRAFLEAFPEGRLTPRGELQVEVGGRTVYVGHDATRNVARIDFEAEKPGVPAEVQAGSLSLVRGLRSLVEKLAATGTGVEYRAVDTNRGLERRQRQQDTGFRRRRADIYADLLAKAGYEQTEGPGIDKNELYVWRPRRTVEQTPTSGRPLEAPPVRPGPPAAPEPALEPPVAPGKAQEAASALERVIGRWRSGVQVPLEEAEGALREIATEHGLSERDQRILTERLTGRSYEDIAGDHKISRQRVQQLEKAALAKLGVAEGSVESLVVTPERLDRALDLIERGQRVSAADLHADPEATRGRASKRLRALDRAEAEMDRLVEDYIKEKEAAGTLPPEREQSYADELSRIGREAEGPTAPAETAAQGRGGVSAERGSGVETPLRREGPEVPEGRPTVAVPAEGPRGPEVPSAQAPAGPGVAAGGAPGGGAAHAPAVAERGAAGGNLLSRFAELEARVPQHGMVDLADLREASSLSKEAFDAEIQRLRSGRVLRLVSSALLSDLPERTRNAAIQGEGETFVSATRGTSFPEERAGGNELTREQARRAAGLTKKEMDSLERAVRGKGLEGALRENAALLGTQAAREYAQRYAEGLGDRAEAPEIRAAADDVQAQDRQMVETHNAMLSRAREALEPFGGHKKILTDRATGRLDASAVRGLDEVAGDLADSTRFGYLFNAREHPSDQLMEMLQEAAATHGRRRLVSREEAIQQARDLREEMQHAEAALRQTVQKPLTREDQAEVGAELAQQEARAARQEAAEGPPAPEPTAASEAIVGDAFEGGSARGPSAGEFDPHADVPFRSERAGRGAILDHLTDSTVRFLGDEGGYFSPGEFADSARQLWDKMKGGLSRLGMSMKELAGRMAPRTTEASQAAGEAVSRFNAAAGYAREATPLYIDRVLGRNATPEDRTLAGAVLTERRLQFMRQAYQQRAAAASRDAAAARAVGDKEGARAAARRATEAMQAAGEVSTVIGKSDSPLADQAAYQAALASPRIQEVLANWKREMVPIMEEAFRRSEGMEDTDPIRSFTQIPGEPINLKPIREGDDASKPVMTGGQRGRIANVKLQKLGFARTARGSAEGYDIDLGSIIENSLSQSLTTAAKHEMMRTLESEGLAVWGVPGARVELGGQPAETIPFVNPPRGTQEAQPGQTTLYVDRRAAGEVRRALAPDEPTKFQTLAAVNGLLTKASLASTVEAAYHSKNLLTMLFKPGVSVVDFLRNTYRVMTDAPGVKESLTELARIGALKEGSHLESGMLWGGATDPTAWMGKFLDVVQRAMRLTADQAFDRLQRSGRVEGSETNRRDFINQLGQYNRKAQHKAVALLRDTGLGPFATAGTNYYAQSLMSLVAAPGAKATSFGHAVGLRAEMLAKMAGVLAVVPLANYFLSGNVNGDDNTPLGAVRLGQNAEGRTSYIDLTNLVGLTRGARQTGLLDVIQGAAVGGTPGQIADRATDNIVHSLLHPAVGPPVQFAYTAATGHSTMGRQVAERPGEGGSQAWNNLRAALQNANPVVGALTGGEHPGRREVPIEERAARLLGPYGPRFRSALDRFNERYFALSGQRQQFAEQRRTGRAFPQEGEFHRLDQFHRAIGQLEHAIQGQASVGGRLQQGQRPAAERVRELRQRQVELARRALEAAR